MRICVTCGLVLLLFACAAVDAQPPVVNPSSRAAPINESPRAASVLATSASATNPPFQAPTPPTLTAAPTTLPVTTEPALTALLQFSGKLHLIDLMTGKDASGLPPVQGTSIPFFAENGKRVALVSTTDSVCEPSGGGTACYPTANELVLVNLQSQLALTMPFSPGGWIGAMAFRADGKRLGLVYNLRDTGTIMLINAENADLLAQRVMDYQPGFVNLSPDGKTLALYAEGAQPSGVQPPGAPRLLVLNGETLEVEWDQVLGDIVDGDWCAQDCNQADGAQLSESWQPAVVAAQDGRQLYILYADADKIMTVDLESRTIRTTALETANGPVENFFAFFAQTVQAKGGWNGVHKYAALSAGGNSLYSVAQTMETSPVTTGLRDTIYAVGALQKIDLSNGRLLAKRTLANREGISEYTQGVYSTPDGAHVFVVRADHNGKWWTEVYDAGTLEPTARVDGWRLLVTYRMNGEPILLAHKPNSSPTQLGLVDPQSFQITRTFSLDSSDGWVYP